MDDRAKVQSVSWRTAGLLVIVFFVTYTPVLTTPYAFMDDYPLLFAGVRPQSWERAQERAMKIADGRPLIAFLIDGAYLSLSHIADLRYLRAVGVFGISLLAWSFCRLGVRAGWGYYPSFFLSIIICTLPSFQVYASWGVLAFAPFAALVAGTAFVLAEQGVDEQSVWLRRLYGIAAVMLFLVALLIYQPAAMFFCVFAAFALLKPDASPRFLLRRLWWHGLIMSVGLLMGFGVSKLGTALYEKELLVPPRSRLTVDVWGKAFWFLSEPLPGALNLMNLFPRWWLSASMLIFIIIGVMLYFHGTTRERLWKSLICFSLIPVSYLPNLMAAESWAAYRTQSALAALVAVSAFFALWGYGRTVAHPPPVFAVTGMLGVVALVSVLCAAHNVSTYFARPQLLELSWLRSQLVRGDLPHGGSIYVIGSRQADLLAPSCRYDEFGCPSSVAAWVPKPAVYLLLREMKPEWADLPIEAVSPNGPFTPPSNALVIDMRKMSEVRERSSGATAKEPEP
jgi:hypothetical protein